MPSVPDRRFHQLEAKERAHDDYVAALREVRRRRARIELEKGPGPFVDGYAQALTDFSEAVVKATRRRHDEALSLIASIASISGILGLG